MSTGISRWWHCLCCSCLKELSSFKDFKISRGWGLCVCQLSLSGSTDSTSGHNWCPMNCTQVTWWCCRGTRPKRSRLYLATYWSCQALLSLMKLSWQVSLSLWLRKVSLTWTNTRKSWKWMTITRITFCIREPIFYSLLQPTILKKMCPNWIKLPSMWLKTAASSVTC